MDKHTYDTINLLAELGFRIGCIAVLAIILGKVLGWVHERVDTTIELLKEIRDTLQEGME